MQFSLRHTLFLSVLVAFCVGLSFLYFPTSRVISEAPPQKEEAIEATLPPAKEVKKHVLVHLNDMTVSLVDASSTVVMPIVSIGKPGNYYETPGGAYTHDYKIKTHFSSFGSVYLPWSVHIFGNFFIHGIPYYPNGTRVDSTYSGGCIRLSDDDAKKVYDFVQRGTLIIIKQDASESFESSTSPYTPATSMHMTRYMTAMVSLEFLNQDLDGVLDGKRATYLDLLYNLLTLHDDRVSTIYASRLGEKTFVDYMNQKARALGLSHTEFTSVTAPAQTSLENLDVFMRYVYQYKSYLKGKDLNR